MDPLPTLNMEEGKLAVASIDNGDQPESRLAEFCKNVLSSELDEKLFINEEDSLLASGSLSGVSVSASSVTKKFDLMASHANGISGSANSKMAATGLSMAMTSAEWLHTVISPLPSKPSQELEQFLTSCDRDVTSEVVRRAQIILQAIFSSSPSGERFVPGRLPSANVMDNSWAGQRKLEALKLYYKVLEAMCSAEAQMLHATKLTSLLTNERLHRGMLACSAELVMASRVTQTVLFPAHAVLERARITAFDYSMVIENFLRHEESLPRELRRYLNSLEERLLESMVWGKGSSMYNSLEVARPGLSAEINRLGLLAEPNPGGRGETCAETGINIFFGKIIKLGAVRISGMVESLQLSQQIRENVYCLFQQILNERTSLFFNRHIDQIILCCFCGVAKISQLNLTFKEIIYNYRKQPQFIPQVLTSVFVDWSLTHRKGRTVQGHVDILTFYNEIFVPSVSRCCYFNLALGERLPLSVRTSLF